jgi:hypothetical protein
MMNRGSDEDAHTDGRKLIVTDETTKTLCALLLDNRKEIWWKGNLVQKKSVGRTTEGETFLLLLLV